MRPGDDDPFPETRAEVARRRLAQLAASFDVEQPPPAAAPAAAPVPTPTRGRRRAGPAPRRVLGVHVRLVATAAVAAGVLLTWWLLAERPRTAADPAPLEVAPAASRPADGPSAGAGTEGEVVVVDVAGKVHEPGIVTLPAGSRVYEAIEAAGGVKGTLEDPTINFARRLVDGEQVLVGVAPAAPDPATAAGPAGGGGPPAGAPLDLNTATAEQLDTLPGIGPVTAKAILDWRAEHGRFASVEDLLEVTGIGDKTLEDLRDLVTV